MGRLEAIDRYIVATIVDSDGKVFVCSFDYRIGAIIRRLEWFADRIPSEEDMRGSRESIREVCGPLYGSG